jgi:hypothetical protein
VAVPVKHLPARLLNAFLQGAKQEGTRTRR